MAFRILRAAVTLVLGAVAAWLIILGGFVKIAQVSGGDFTASALLNPALMIVAGLMVAAVCWYAVWSQSRVRRSLENICSIPELVRKLAFTLGLLCIYRIGFHVPLPGLNQERVAEFMTEQSQGVFGSAIQYFGLFTGGTLQQATLFGLGIMPYISASIIFQLLTTVVPALEKLQKEGPAGYKKIQEYTRYATVGLCIVQAVVWMRIMTGAGGGPRAEPLVYPEYVGSYLVFIMGVVGLTGGTMFLMWLGEQIDEYGIGNGISLIIMAGIVSRLPWAVMKLAESADLSLAAIGATGKTGPEKVLFLVFAFAFVVAGVILITQGQRRIPIQQAKHTRGRRVYGGQRNYMPLRVNHGGVMPIIFASSLMIFPNALFRWLYGVWRNDFTRTLSDAFSRESYTYALVYIGMIFFFAYFWTTVQFRPKEMADQLRDTGAFIPGLRPGKRTADYLERVMERITYCGAAFLAVIAVIPMFVAGQMKIDWTVAQFLGGTGLLICVSVTLDLVQRIEANLVMRNYGGFLGGSTRIKGAYR
ncbi:MAG TPA: preprotein translocase subunit SecY [Phycisphaerae bacterium]|nr:preprotein translocase subunit SecY [Phycisphaerae bacterium]